MEPKKSTRTLPDFWLVHTPYEIRKMSGSLKVSFDFEPWVFIHEGNSFILKVFYMIMIYNQSTCQKF